MLNLEWYRTFKMIYESGTLSAAAKSVFLSQPGVSLHLHSLEAYTGCRLFERESRKLVPTDRGTFLYDYIIDALLKLEELEKVIHGKSTTEKPIISIGMCYTTFEHILEGQVCKLPFKLITRFGECDQLMDDLEKGKIDFVISSKPSLKPELYYTPFSKERIVLIAGGGTDTTELDSLIQSNHKLAIMNWLSKQRWYVTAADMEYLKSFWLSNFEVLPEFSPDLIVPHFSSILRCLKNDEGFTVMPDFLCRTEVLDRSVKLAWPESTELENTLYFGKRTKTVYPKEIGILEDLLIKNWFKE